MLVAMVGWLLEGWNQLRARTRCFWDYMRAYFWWLRCRCIRFWLRIPEPPPRDPPHIDLTEEQLAKVLGKPNGQTVKLNSNRHQANDKKV